MFGLGFVFNLIFNRELIPSLLKFFASPLGYVFALVVIWFVSGWYHARHERAVCAATIANSQKAAQARDNAIAANAARIATLDRAELANLAATQQRRLEEYDKSRAKNPACLLDDSDLRYLNNG